MKKLLDVSGCYVDGHNTHAFSLVIVGPEHNPTLKNHYCKIMSEELFAKDMKVSGVTPYQAVKLAFAVANAKLTCRVANFFSDDIPEE